MLKFNFNFKTIQPARDWKIIIWSFAILLITISIFAWTVYLSNEIGGGYFANPAELNESKPRTIDIRRLQKNVAITEGRQQSFSQLKNNFIRVVDPSI